MFYVKEISHVCEYKRKLELAWVRKVDVNIQFYIVKIMLTWGCNTPMSGHWGWWEVD
jgi:hypothetical protein